MIKIAGHQDFAYYEVMTHTARGKTQVSTQNKKLPMCIVELT